MDGLLHLDGRRAEVLARLATVTDPELDEAVTDLGFIEEVVIAPDSSVDVAFRLPTYWCSANFAFLMADDIRQAVEALPWVRVARPFLRDHMTADEINDGVQSGRSFGDVFARFGAAGTLDDLRETFRRKAFERRQEAVILALRKAGFMPAAICGMSLQVLDALSLDGIAGGDPRPRYRSLLVDRDLARRPEDPAFVSYDGDRLSPDAFQDYVRRLRGVRINMEFGSVLCRGLLEARYQGVERTPGEVTGARTTCGKSCGRPCGSPGGIPVPAVHG